MKHYTSEQAAQYFIAFNRAEVRLGNEQYVLNETKLEQLLYFTQGFCLYAINQPFMNDNFILQKQGPVILDIRKKYHNLDIPKLNQTISLEQTTQLLDNLRLIEDDDLAHDLLINVYLKRKKLMPLYQTWQNDSNLHGKIISNKQIKEAFDNYIDNSDVLNEETDLSSPLVE